MAHSHLILKRFPSSLKDLNRQFGRHCFPGNTVVQRDTNHAWRNPSPDEAGRVMVCMIEARP